ncbi:MAG: DNA primase [Eubacteriales bacterium]|nr:DNA primase [Eubacteriales bacterium]MDY3941938.1 DNA primase [Eubacteriales bacterium]
MIEDIRARCDIETIIQSYVTLRKTGTNEKGLCPFHSERTPSFTVYPATQSFYCFGCGAGGDVITFIMKIENLDYRGAVEFLAEKAGIALPAWDGSELVKEGVSRKRILEMNLEAARFYRSMLFDEKIGAPGREYFFEKRGLSPATIRHFGLGYAPPYGSMTLQYMKSRGFTEEELREGYFCGKNERGYYDYFRGRVMYPIIDVSGNVIAFGGRVLGDEKPKYLNTSDTPAFKKSRNLFALNYAKNHCENGFILCEGYMDVIALHAAGFENAVAGLGTAFGDEQARILKKYSENVTLCYDSDEAGQKATARTIPILEKAGLTVRMLRLPEGKDPDEFIKKNGADAFRAVIEGSRSKFDYILESVRGKYTLDDTEEKLRAIGEVCRYIAGVYSQVERDLYIARAAQAFSVDPKSVRGDVEAQRRRNNRANDKKRREELIRVTAGLSDRVNPDYAKQPRSARMEEEVLGMLLLHPEYMTLAERESLLNEEMFPTALGKRIYTWMKARLPEEPVSISYMGEDFTPEEIGRAAKMLAGRSELAGNDEKTFRTYAASLRESARENSADASLEDIIHRKREQRKP